MSANYTCVNIVVKDTDGLIIGGAGVRTLAGNGNIDVDVDAGNLTMDNVVTAHGSGTIDLNADSGTVDINAVISSSTGAIDIDGNVVTQDANVSTGGAVSVSADSGAITMGNLTA